MALDQSALLELLESLKAAGAEEMVRRAVEAVLQGLIESEAAARIGADPHERTSARVMQRNGYRDRLLTTAAGDVERCRSRSCGPVRSSRPCWSGARGSIRPCSRW
jgi:putative transposase